MSENLMSLMNRTGGGYAKFGAGTTMISDPSWVTRGLMAHWTSGGGKTETGKWTDDLHGITMSEYRFVLDDNGFYEPGKNGNWRNLILSSNSFPPSGSFTLECVCGGWSSGEFNYLGISLSNASGGNFGRGSIAGPHTNLGLYARNKNGTFWGSDKVFPDMTKFHTFSVVDDGSETKFFVDANLINLSSTVSTCSLSEAVDRMYCVNKNTYKDVRIYNVELRSAELTANAQKDKQYYGLT